MSSLQYLDFVNIQIPKEGCERIAMVGLMAVKSVIANYLPAAWVNDERKNLF
jgi:hypothetical protein